MPSSLTDNQRGIVAVCACMGSYTVNDVLVKQILLTAPAGEVILVRGVMCSLLIAAVGQRRLREALRLACTPPTNEGHEHEGVCHDQTRGS